MELKGVSYQTAAGLRLLKPETHGWLLTKRRDSTRQWVITTRLLNSFFCAVWTSIQCLRTIYDEPHFGIRTIHSPWLCVIHHSFLRRCSRRALQKHFEAIDQPVWSFSSSPLPGAGPSSIWLWEGWWGGICGMDGMRIVAWMELSLLSIIYCHSLLI